jgi:hypothetical protein
VLAKFIIISYAVTLGLLHTAWLIGSILLLQDILPKIDSCLLNGINDFYIISYSQGGAITYLMTSLIHDLKKRDEKYKDLPIKTYANAATKAGNLYYAH